MSCFWYIIVSALNKSGKDDDDDDDNNNNAHSDNMRKFSCQVLINNLKWQNNIRIDTKSCGRVGRTVAGSCGQ